MSRLEEIRRPVMTEISRYEDYLRSSIFSDHRMTGAMLDYIFENRGKGIRPLLALLCASMLKKGGELTEKTYLSAMLVEMMHTASLVHDDVIDESMLRRGKPSVKARWQSHRAVLIGDYILARSYCVGMQSESYEIVSCVVNAMKVLCEGELLQSDQSDRLEMTRDIYNDIIYKKTASLMSVSSSTGALSVGAAPADVEAMVHFGRDLGMAFQIKDDILDYSSSRKTGKPRCGDIKERKINLPMLMVLEKLSGAEREQMISLMRDVKETPENALLIYEQVVSAGGPALAAAEMERYIDHARTVLTQYPDSPYRRSLDMLCGYIADREV